MQIADRTHIFIWNIYYFLAHHPVKRLFTNDYMNKNDENRMYSQYIDTYTFTSAHEFFFFAEKD